MALLFLGIVVFHLFTDGMFMDGLIYSALSNNMANGFGSFWSPYLSNSVFPEFYEHPPLALGIQSMWFQLFGDSIYIERLYSLFTYLLTGIATVLCWKELGNKVKTGWIPLLFWLLVTNVQWAIANNMLENTMTVFVVFSAYFCLKGINRSKVIYIVIGGLLLSLSVLSKGFVGLYIWIIPFTLFLFLRKQTIISMAIKTIVLVLSTALPILLLYLFSEDASNNFTNYINNQVLKSIETAVTVNSRYQIFLEFIQHILVPLGLAILIFLFGRKTVDYKTHFSKNKKLIFAFCFLLFCGIAPIMVSLKQSGFYILTIYPFFGILMGLIILPIIEKWMESNLIKAKNLRYLKVVAFAFLTAVFAIAINKNGEIGRDIPEVNDAYIVINHIGKDTEIDICKSQFNNWSKHGYYSRYGKITLLRESEKNAEFYLVSNDDCKPNPEQYKKVNLEMMNHTLYQKK